MPGSKLKNYLQLHFIVFIWGFTAILGKLIQIEAVSLVWYRMLLAVIFIAFYLLRTPAKFRLEKKAVLKFVFSGIIIAVHWITFFKAIKVSNVSVALVTMSTGAFFTAFLEPIFFKRKMNPVEFLMGFLVVVGLYIIFNFESQYTLGILYALLSSFLSALFSVLNGLYIKKYDATTISFYQLLFGVVAVSCYLVSQATFTSSFFAISTMDWVYLFVLSSVCTAYAFIASVKVMKYLTPYTVMLTINLEPIYAIVLALLIFGESEEMKPEFYLGAVIVLGVVLVNGLIKNKLNSKLKIKLKNE